MLSLRHLTADDNDLPRWKALSTSVPGLQISRRDAMPKMFVHAPNGAFTPEARAAVAAELTDLGMACERLIDTPKTRAGIWVYFVEHAPDTVFRAGLQATQPIMSLKVYALKGGLNELTKTRMVAEATAILGKHSGTESGQVPAYVGILEVPEENWGMYGQQVHLATMQVKP
jgi:phenylpyruvate tautomerase PptA (4-oxalocrotonate tautomerase family)